MKKLSTQVLSLLSGMIFASLISFALPANTTAIDSCADDCQAICGSPGNAVCTGLTCETGSVICTKEGEPGIPGEDD
jgi:hypothetical protein